MIFITGDVHGKVEHFDEFLNSTHGLTKNDFVIVAGDFGCIWDGGLKDKLKLEYVDNLPFTLLFVDGNHENFTLLNKYPVIPWNGGKVHKIGESTFHLMRGEVFAIGGKTFFVMGGGYSGDAQYRNPLVSWWEEEQPSGKEFMNGLRNLDALGWEVDYVVTHTVSKNTLGLPQSKTYRSMDNFFDLLVGQLRYKTWFFGHHHKDTIVNNKFTMVYNSFLEIG